MVCIVIPTYNEVSNICRLVERIEDSLAGDDLTVIIVDDNSPDGTAQVAQRLGAIYGNILVYERAARLGIGSAICDGLRLALSSFDPEAIVTMDADLSHDPRDIGLLLRECVNADLVQASRYIKGGKIVGWPFFRKTTSWVSNQMCARLLKTSVRDHTSYFRAYSRKMANIIITNGMPTGFEFAISSILLARNHNLRVKEVPVAFVNRSYGKSKLRVSDIVRWFLFLAGTCLRRRRGTLFSTTKGT